MTDRLCLGDPASLSAHEREWTQGRTPHISSDPARLKTPLERKMSVPRSLMRSCCHVLRRSRCSSPACWMLTDVTVLSCWWSSPSACFADGRERVRGDAKVNSQVRVKGVRQFELGSESGEGQGMSCTASFVSYSSRQPGGISTRLQSFARRATCHRQSTSKLRCCSRCRALNASERATVVLSYWDQIRAMMSTTLSRREDWVAGPLSGRGRRREATSGASPLERQAPWPARGPG